MEGNASRHTANEAACPPLQSKLLCCLNADEGARMCEAFSNWVMTQPDLIPRFGSPTASSPEKWPKSLNKHGAASALASSTFTSIFSTPLSLPLEPLASLCKQPAHVSETQVPVTVLRLPLWMADVVVEDL